MPITLVGGAFQDALGNLVTGTLILQLSQDAKLISTNAQITPQPVNITVTGGSISGTYNIYGVDEIVPANLYYTATLIDSNGRTVWGPEKWLLINGGTLDVGSLVPSFSGGVVVFMPASFAYVTVAYSATPTFPGATATDMTFEITLTGAVSSSTLSGITKGAHVIFVIIQDSSGGRTFAWPTNVKNAQSVDPTINARCIQEFIYDGTNCYPIGPMTVN